MQDDSDDNSLSNFSDDIEDKDEIDPNLFTVHGKNYRFWATSVNIFDNKNFIRKLWVWIAWWKWFDRIIIAIIILNSLFLGIMDYTDNDNVSWRNQLSVQTEPVFTTIFTLEWVIKIVATGLIIGKGTYLSDPWNWIDFLVVISGLLTAVPQVQNVSALRTFRLFRPLRSLSTLPNIRILIGTLLSSVAQLGGVLGLALFFFLIFAILGVNLFAGLEDYRCRETPYPVNGDWIAYPSDTRLWGYRSCSEGWWGSLIEANDNAHNITMTDLYRDSNIVELNYGLTNFDNIIYAFLTIFQWITLEGWSEIMYMMQDAYSKWISSIYFVLVTVIWAYFLINLTIAVMLKNYDELDKNEKNTEYQANLIELGMNAKLPSRLIYFIVGEENLIISKKAKRRLKDHEEQLSWTQKLIKNFVYAKVDIPHDTYYKWKITRFFYHLISMPIFGTVILIWILSNTLILSLQRYPMPPDEDYAYNIINSIFTCIFALEVILKLIALSPKKFILDKFNIFDSVVVLISFSDFFVSSGGGGVSALRAFRLFRIFKLFRTGNLRVLLDSIAYTMSTIGNYVLLLSLFIYVYSLLGMQFFAGALRFNDQGYYDPNGQLARSNFDTLYWAAITVFEVLIGDNWNNIMYDWMLGAGSLSAIYFITLILFGNIIMLNLFLAILLGNFSKARTFWLKKNIFEMFGVAVEKQYSLSKAINIILGEVSKSVKEELLVHEPRDIFRLNGRLAIINRKLMINDPEAEDKLDYYDKVAEFELDYQPITAQKSEYKDDDADDQKEEYLDDDQLSKDINESSMKSNNSEEKSSLFNRDEENQLNNNLFEHVNSNFLNQHESKELEDNESNLNYLKYEYFF